ncbi:mycofactocin precursor MftA [Actinomadura chokoriensis]|uniref:Mycofactocin MftA n=1 Tax=Actinomadura chokoriensis TaxID=454156 RepID=A0ABV4QS68_9ACTN
MDTAPDLEAQNQADDMAEELAAAESLIEEVSIDGMCGVY